MNKRIKIKTTIEEAVDYWSQRVDECELSVDWAEAHTHCWRCGCEKHLERCHIVPDSLGGEDCPSNIVLLCKQCHGEGPNVTDPEIMWDWIKAYSVPFYNTFWSLRGLKEYQFIYGKTVTQEFNDICQQAKISHTDENAKQLLNQYYKEVLKEAGTHFGQPYFNSATLAGILRMMLKQIAQELNVTFPLKNNQKRDPWWIE